MSYPKNGKPSKLKPIGSPKLEDLGDDYKQAIVNHPDCKAIFEKLMSEGKLSVSKNSKTIIAAFNKLLPELSDNQLNISESAQEYEPLFDLLTGNHTGVYPVNTGLFILMMTLLRKNAGKLYAATIKERLGIFHACDAVSAEMKELLIPVRDKCIKDFYEAATVEQWDDVRDMVKHHNNPKSHGMPGNQGVANFGM